jgi:hypothetical protein
VSDSRSTQRGAERRQRRLCQRKVRRRQRLNTNSSPLSHEGSTWRKYNLMKSQVRKLAQQVHDGTVEPFDQDVAGALHYLATEEWHFAEIARMKRSGHGDVTPGPDGLTLRSLEEFADDHDIDPASLLYAYCRQIRSRCSLRWLWGLDGDDIPNEVYRPGPLREFEVLKKSGKPRRIGIANLQDWLVAKALRSVAGPLLETGLPDTVTAYHKGCGPERSILTVIEHAEQHGGSRFLIGDIRNAFPSVRHDLLRPVLEQKIPNEEVVKLLMDFQRAERAGHGKPGFGLHQGDPNSPALLNAYLAHYLDIPWRERFPQWPLVRYGDDIVVVTKSKREARAAHRELDDILGNIDMTLRAEKTRNIDVRNRPFEYLGFTIRKVQTGFSISLPHKFAQRIRDVVHRRTRPDTERMEQGLTGLFAYFGPAWDSDDIDKRIQCAIGVAADSLRGPIDPTELHKTLRAAGLNAKSRWRDRCRNKGIRTHNSTPAKPKEPQENPEKPSPLRNPGVPTNMETPGILSAQWSPKQSTDTTGIPMGTPDTRPLREPRIAAGPGAKAQRRCQHAAPKCRGWHVFLPGATETAKCTACPGVGHEPHLEVENQHMHPDNSSCGANAIVNSGHEPSRVNSEQTGRRIRKRIPAAPRHQGGSKPPAIPRQEIPRVPAGALAIVTNSIMYRAGHLRPQHRACLLDLGAAVLAGKSPVEHLVAFLEEQPIPSMQDQAVRLRATMTQGELDGSSSIDADEASEPLVLETDGIQLADLGIPDCEAVTSSSEDAATSDCFELAML